ncbi:hypothetical protein E2320_010231 [Naja naja]|nr:hypothetical protein E2320_010231 [Naja naja]
MHSFLSFTAYRSMEPWLQGVIAVSVFLVLAMIAFIINKLWCQDEKCEEDPHVYENKVEFECDTMTGHHTENHINDGFQCDTMTECHTVSCADITTDM